MKLAWLSFFILLKAIQSSAVLHESIDTLPTNQYDFIIVGGGTAGNVIANRLTENPKWKILVIETGPSNEGVINSIVPFFFSRLERTQFDWNYTTTPQPALGGKVLGYPRGHILGGSSSINGMFYTRGSSSDFDRYAEVTGDPGWSWDNLQRYIRRNERWTTPVDNHNTTGQFDPAVHGFNGINAVSLVGYPQSIDPRILQTTKDLPDEFPFNLDMNSGNPLGLGYLQQTIKKGKRSSSATSYLAPQFLNRPNLDVVINSRVTRIIKTGDSNDIPIFGAVEVGRDVNDTGSQRMFASKEIILATGVIGTPQLLLISGIGESSELRSIGVEPVVNSPDVGRNFQDQPTIVLTWLVNITTTNDSDNLDDIARDPELQAKYLQQWQTNQTGPFASVGDSFVAWGRLPDNSSIFQTQTDPASGLNTPHYEIAFTNGAFIPTGEGHHFSTVNAVVSPASRGNVTLQTSNPFDQPLINPGLMTSEFDLVALRESAKASFRLVAAPAWNDYILQPVGGLENVTTDDELDGFILRSAILGLHGVGTAAMSRQGDEHGVVGPDLRVKGTEGLRVVDASVMPFVPAGHTQAPVYIIAERAADLIKEFWRG